MGNRWGKLKLNEELKVEINIYVQCCVCVLEINRVFLNNSPVDILINELNCVASQN